MKYLIIFLSTFIFQQLSAQVYEGDIGGYPIFLVIHQYKNEPAVSMSYCYKSRLRDLHGKGIREEDDYFLDIIHKYQDEQEKFKLRRNGKFLNGTWTRKNQTLEVALEEVENIPFQEYGNLYNDQKRALIQFERGKKTKHDGFETIQFTEKYSGIKQFRFGNGFSSEFRQKINPWLDNIHSHDALEEFECGYDLHKVSTPYVGKIVSFRKDYSIYCHGAAHPNHGQITYNINYKNGKLLDWKDVVPDLSVYELFTKERRHITAP